MHDYDRRLFRDALLHEIYTTSVTPLRPGMNGRTGVRLDPGRNFACAYFVEVSYVLTKHRAQVQLANPLCNCLGRVDPDSHVHKGRDSHSKT